mmetsp:Transcript_60906/g.145154  ORF Transcript_60906/g.145154 Transcript_60906/m.145154 type:complete len:349 (-) Transcript_60906:185-1231(-)
MYDCGVGAPEILTKLGDQSSRWLGASWMQGQSRGRSMASSHAPRQQKRPASATAVYMVAGAAAGVSVEVCTFPLDCLKTRAQSRDGLRLPGAFRGVYRGVGTAIASAAPSSALFFVVYELSHGALRRSLGVDKDDHNCRASTACSAAAIASTLGEAAACTLRVPTDIVKQRLQTGYARDVSEAVRSLISGGLPLVKDSFRTTALRDIMHSSVQFPIYEGLKLTMMCHFSPRGKATAATPSDELKPFALATCGSAAGALSAFVTTPLDWLRTRVNLRMGDSAPQAVSAQGSSYRAVVLKEARDTLQQQGLRGLFAGAGFRAATMGVGGFVFFGAFEGAKRCLHEKWDVH